MAAGAEYSGPKYPTTEQVPAVVALSNRVFMADNEPSMAALFPLLFHPERLEQMLICEHKGDPVSLVGMTVDRVSMLGCETKVACIGSVCTDEAHRGHGLAGRLMDAAVDQAVAAAAPIMLISGDRTLYSRRGAYRDGLFRNYRIPAEALPTAPAGMVSRDVVTREDRAAALALHEAEPVRFRRDEDDYRLRLETEHMMCGPARTLLICQGSRPLAVASVDPEDKPGKPWVVEEMAGSRWAILQAASRWVADAGASGLEVRGYPCDVALAYAAADLGVTPEERPFAGTVKVLDVERLWSDFAPLLADRMGWRAFEDIELRPDADELKLERLAFRRGAEEVAIEGDRSVLRCLFGSPDGTPLDGMAGELAEDLRRGLSLPLPLYGLNYI